jgi:hypothetical protein
MRSLVARLLWRAGRHAAGPPPWRLAVKGRRSRSRSDAEGALYRERGGGWYRNARSRHSGDPGAANVYAAGLGVPAPGGWCDA